jgi:hypothetical protein
MEYKINNFYKMYTTKFKNGKNLLELTSYDGVSYWWSIDRLFFEYINRLTNYRYSESIRKRIIIFIYRLAGVYINAVLDIILLGILKTIRWFTGKKEKINNAINDSNKIIFTSSDFNWRYEKGDHIEEHKKKDVFFDSIIKELKINYKLMGTHFIDIKFFQSIKVFIEKIKNWDIVYNPINIYWDKHIYSSNKIVIKEFKDRWNYIKKDPVLEELFDNKNRNHIMLELEFYFLVVLPHVVKYKDLAVQMIKKEGPNLILLVNEYSWRERSLVIAAQLLNIPVMAVQHGVIHEFHRGYMYRKKEITLGCPLPDITAVYGSYYYNLLTGISSYPKDSVIVTGQPRYDHLFAVEQKYLRNQVISKYKINPNSKIILWTTQCHGLSMKENNVNFETVFDCIDNIKEEITLIIKQHPGETNRYTKMIHRILKKYKINVIITAKDADTYELIYACDVLMTKSSTTVLEAILLDKPVIVLNLSGEQDVINFVQEGVAKGVYNRTSLEPTIVNLLNNDDLKTYRQKFISQYLFKNDGMATSRVIQAINSIIDRGDVIQTAK